MTTQIVKRYYPRMSPQKFVKQAPPGWIAQYAPESEEGGDWRIVSTPTGFDIHFDVGFLYPRPEVRSYSLRDKIAVRLPDGRLVIPTVRGEKSK